MKKCNALNKAKDQLKARIESYEETCRTRTDNGKGFTRPGSLKIRKN